MRSYAGLSLPSSAVVQDAIIEGRAWCGGATLTPGAGNSAVIQLANPAGSGVKIFVFECECSFNSNTSFTFGIYGIAIATLVGNGAPLTPGGGIAKGEIRTEGRTDFASVPYFDARALANTEVTLVKDVICGIFPNADLAVRSSTVAGTMIARFFWIEVPN